MTVYDDNAISRRARRPRTEWPDIREAKAIAEEGFIYGLPIVDELCGHVRVFRRQEFRGNTRRRSKPDQQRGAGSSLTKTLLVITAKQRYGRIPLPARSARRTDRYYRCQAGVEEGRYYSVMLCDRATRSTTVTSAAARPAAIPETIWSFWTRTGMGATPAGIKKVFRATTQFSALPIGRKLFNPRTCQMLRRYKAGYKVQPLSAYLKQPHRPPAAAIRLSQGQCRVGEEELLRIPRLLLSNSPGWDRKRRKSAPGSRALASGPARPLTSRIFGDTHDRNRTGYERWRRGRSRSILLTDKRTSMDGKSGRYSETGYSTAATG